MSVHHCNRYVTLSVFLALLGLAACAQAGTIVRFTIGYGNQQSFMDVQLYDGATPLTVKNFLDYVNAGDYAQSFFHRLDTEPGCSVLQGGGFRLVDAGASIEDVPANNPITLEPGLSNVRGTIAMARTADLNSATNQFYFNTQDNTDLDTASGGYAVFGHVIDSGMSLIDTLASCQAIDMSGTTNPANQAWQTVPVMNLQGNSVGPDNLLVINSAQVIFSSSFIGDTNADGNVDVVDLGILATNWKRAAPAGWNEGNFTADMNVDENDFLGLQSNWKTSDNFNVGESPTPEPASLILLAIGSLVLGCRRR